MNLFTILKKRSGFFYVSLGLLALIKSLSTTSTLMFINFKLSNVPLPIFPNHDVLVFISILVISFFSTKFFQEYIIKLTRNISMDFEMSIFRKLKNSTYTAFEKLGNERVYTAIGDIGTLVSLPTIFINVFNSLVIVVCCFVYLFWMSPLGGAMVLSLMLVLLVVYLVRNSYIMKHLNKLRDLQNVYHLLLNDLLLGFKELKMSRARSKNFYTNHLETNCYDRRTTSIRTAISYTNNELLGSYSWYAMIGVVIFALPAIINVQWNLISVFAITIFYLMGPVSVLITLFPVFSSAKIASERLTEFNKMLDEYIEEENISFKSAQFGNSFDSLTLENVSFKYFDKDKKELFKFGPINMRIHQGEVIFITGGNGSGKSTFVNLITALYKPAEGTIHFNKMKVHGENAAFYRDKISVIFTNNYMFSENYDDFFLHASNSQLNTLIDTMRLTEVVRIDNQKKNIDSRLSKGQQKRLALIYALLENKDLIVLDEWAAEQDPVFREYFYNEIIHELRMQGKTVIAVTHDDNYYSAADRIIKLDFGQVVSDVRIRATEVKQ